MSPPDIINWHHLETTAVVDALDSHIEKGVSSDEAGQRLATLGPNVLSTKKGHGPIVRFLLQFHQPLVYILLAAAATTAWLQHWIDASVIFAVVFINSIVGFLQEAKALKALEALSKIMRAEARVIRNGKTREMPAADLVPGDIVLLQSGEKVPADMRLLRIHELRVDESALTGESVPVGKHVDVLRPETVLADRKNMIFASTLVTYGQCKGIVVDTGNRTEIGHISELIAEAEVLETPLTRKIKVFSKLLLYIILGLAAVTFAAGISHGQAAVETFMAAVALAVAAIPEGLPAAFTIILAIGVGRMTQRNAIIRKLPAVETLGSTTVICSDKTGTLTENQMTVQEIAVDGKHYRVSGTGYLPQGEITDIDTGSSIVPAGTLRECLLAGLLCNDSLLVEENGQWEIEGDPTEGALLVAARKAGLTEEHYLEALPRLNSLPFESEYQYMATLHDGGTDVPRPVYIKGAVETILEKCDRMLEINGEQAPLRRDEILDAATNMARAGMRVLAFARTELPTGTSEFTHQDIATGLKFLGIQGMIDPPRQAATEAIEACHAAGIRVKMITGDHAGTAAAIARQMDLDGRHNQDYPEVITGRQIMTLNDEKLADIVNKVAVFARVSPEQKLRLVKALQSQGHVVAMTGDGVNDAPALRQADIGVAMGSRGTEVAKEASDMVLTDDNFETIEAAVEEGRGVFDNLTKFIVWTLPTNMGEALIVLAAVFMGLTLPVLPIHILWINMTTALLLGLMLAFEQKEPGIMARPPRDPAEPIITTVLGLRIVMVSVLMTIAVFLLFQWEINRGLPIETARTVAVNMIIMVEVFYLFNCRSLSQSMFTLGVFSNKWLLTGVAGMALLQVLFTYSPVANRVFGTTTIGLDAWLRIVLIGVLVYTIIGLEKWVRRRREHRRYQQQDKALPAFYDE